MKATCADVYRTPGDPKERLKLEILDREGDEVRTGRFLIASGIVFSIERGVPDFTWPLTLAAEDAASRTSYDRIADDYDKFAPLPFRTLRSDEWAIRGLMIDDLHLRDDATVLEIGCGGGRGSKLIAERLGRNAVLYLQELSPRLLCRAVEALRNCTPEVEFSVGNGSYLPFPDRYFDAAHHFGGINTFSEIQRCLAELARVVKPGGRVVVGDESIGHWLRNTEFARIMMNSNPLFRCDVPVALLPPTARDVKIQWVAMDAFYYIAFTVAEGAPEADYHVQIPSERGGSHWTRYHGNLEGVTDEAKHLAHAARKKSGKSMHQWLDDVVRAAAKKELGEG